MADDEHDERLYRIYRVPVEEAEALVDGVLAGSPGIAAGMDRRDWADILWEWMVRVRDRPPPECGRWAVAVWRVAEAAGRWRSGRRGGAGRTR